MAKHTTRHPTTGQFVPKGSKPKGSKTMPAFLKKKIKGK